MDRANKILNHDLFIESMEKIRQAEKEREFCRHDMNHLLDVARIGMIINLTKQYGEKEEHIYAVALLHDIGKPEQYEAGIPHELAAGEKAGRILKECGFDDNETCVIIQAITLHRNPDAADIANLSGILYQADKASRACFACTAMERCNWSKEKKNLSLKY